MTANPRATRLPVRALRILTLLAALAPASAGAVDWRVQGQVLFSDGSAASSALVRLQAPGGSASTLTDAGGWFVLVLSDATASGWGTLWAERGGCTSPPRTLIDRDVTTDLTIPGAPGSC